MIIVSALFLPKVVDGLPPPTKLSALLIRSLQARDLPALTDLLVDSFHDANLIMQILRPVLWLGTQDELKRRFYATAPDRSICLVAVVNAQTNLHEQISEGSTAKNTQHLVGTIEIASHSTSMWQPLNPRSLYLSSLAIQQGYRRQGIAQKLLHRCEQVALSKGFQDLYLHVMEHNHAATQLYFKMGYGLSQADPGWLSLIPGYSRRLFLHKRLSPMTV